MSRVPQKCVSKSLLGVTLFRNEAFADEIKLRKVSPDESGTRPDDAGNREAQDAVPAQMQVAGAGLTIRRQTRQRRDCPPPAAAAREAWTTFFCGLQQKPAWWNPSFHTSGLQTEL